MARTTSQSIPSAAWTKIQLATEEVDSHGYFDPITNYRFTPLIAGWYDFKGQIAFVAPGVLKIMQACIFKNGAATKPGVVISSSTAGYDASPQCFAETYMNGTTDYVELYGWNGDTVGVNTSGGAGYVYLMGHRIMGT